VVNFVSLWGWAPLPTWLLWMAPTIFLATIYILMWVRQTQARQRAQALLRELETAHRQLADYAAQVEDLTLAAERQRMARELHDTLAQDLAGLILQLEATDSHLVGGRLERAQAIVQQAMARARAALAGARRAIDDLRAGPSAPDALVEAIQAEARRFSGATGIDCALELPAALSLAEPAG